MMGLTEFLALYQEPAPFDWGTRSCCSFCAHWVREREGFSPLDGLGEIQTEDDVRRVLAGLGGMFGAWTTQLRREQRPGRAAMPGDVVVVPCGSAEGYAAGVCVGAQVAVLTASGALSFVPISQALASWRIK